MSNPSGEVILAVNTEERATLDPQEVRWRVASVLERVSAQMLRRMNELEAHQAERDATVRQLQARIAELGQLAAGLAIVDETCLPVRGAGYGSVVRVQKLNAPTCTDYTLMVGALVDLDANQVSLASPMGRALIGRMPGDLISLETPQGELQLRLLRVATITERLEALEIISAT